MKHDSSNQFLNEFDFLGIIISRDEVESGNINFALSTLRKLLENPEVASKFQENVDISFQGYENDSRELFEIPEVRDFVYALDNEFPYWLYFLSKYYLGLTCIIYCFLPPYLTDEGKAEIYPQRIEQYLLNRGFPAMNRICEYAGCSEKEIEEMTDRVMKYIQFGRFHYE